MDHARRVCRSCYKAQVKAEQAASVPLPGTFDMARCERVTAGIGKCSVCGLEKAAWIDQRADVRFYEHCFWRETRSTSKQRSAGMTVPPALLSHESTEHYTPQYILDAVIACMGAIDLDPCSNGKEIPNVTAAISSGINKNQILNNPIPFFIS